MACKKAKTGRLPKLTPEVAKIIVDNVTAGVPQKYAAERAGVTERTLMRWLAAGRKARSGPLLSLLSALKKGEADCIARNVANIQRAASGVEEVTVKETITTDANGQTITKRETTTKRAADWCAAAWYLERTCTTEYGRPHKPDSTDEKKKPTPLVVKGEADPDEL